MKEPFVIYHWGKQPYVQCAIDSIVRNTGREAVVIGNHQWKNCRNVSAYFQEWAFYNEYVKAWPDRPAGTTSFEGCCLRAWFALDRIMRDEGLKYCVRTDSDVLWFDDPMKSSLVNANDITLSFDNGCGTASCGQFSYRAVKGFCDWCWQELRQNPTNPVEISNDMAAWTKFAACNPQFKTTDTRQIIDGTTFDHHLRSGAEFEAEPCPMDGKMIRKVEFVEGLPYSRLVSTGEQVRFYNLHFWNGLKDLIPEYWVRALESERT